MKETGFVAYQHEVKAILEGRQTMFWRVIKPQPVFVNSGGRVWTYEWKGQYVSLRKGLPELCPYGQVGDRLWVREAYRTMLWTPGEVTFVRYTADDEWRQVRTDYDAHVQIPTGHPSIHMPRWASRITLEITGVKVERIQDISLADIAAEGTPYNEPHDGPVDAVDFAYLWGSINAKRGYGWDANPLVWVPSVRRVSE